MFCSRCGKTIPQGAEKCPGCGLTPEFTGFSEASYIGSLPAAGSSEPRQDDGERARFARVSYTTLNAGDDDAIRRTGYRPAFREEKPEEPAAEEKPESASDGEKTPEAAAPAKSREDEPEIDIIEEELPDSFKVRPLKEVVVKGLSDETRARMKQAAEIAASPDSKTPRRPVVTELFSGTGRGAATKVPKRVTKPDDEIEAEGEYAVADTETVRTASTIVKRAPAAETESGGDDAVYDDDEDFGAASRPSFSIKGILGKLPFGRKDAEDYIEDEEEEAAPDDEPSESTADTADDTAYTADNADDYAPEDEDDGEYEERPRLFSFRREDREPVSGPAAFIRIAIIAIVVIALLAGGFVWLSLRTAARSQVTGVTHSFFDNGVKLITSHTTAEYRNQMTALFAEDPTGTLTLQKQAEDRAAIEALIPGTPLANDQEFLDTLLKIQESIDTAVTLDALGADAEGSQTRWDAIATSIEMLSVSSSAGEFSSISDTSEVKATDAPEPTPTVSPYSTLTKGMKDNEDVKKMQARLYDLGWFNDVRDGDFGAVTQNAVKAFQQECGLSVTGIADPETLEAIYAEDAPRTGSKITAAPADPNQ